MFTVKACDSCMDGKKEGDTFSVDIKNVTQNWEYGAKCDICGKDPYEGVISVTMVGKKGDIVTVKVSGLRKND